MKSQDITDKLIDKAARECAGEVLGFKPSDVLPDDTIMYGFKVGVRWTLGRVHKAKFKTLEDIGWWLDHQNLRSRAFYVNTPLGRYYAYQGDISWWMEPDRNQHHANDLANAMELAQVHYTAKLKEFLHEE